MARSDQWQLQEQRTEEVVYQALLEANQADSIKVTSQKKQTFYAAIDEWEASYYSLKSVQTDMYRAYQSLEEAGVILEK